MWESSWDIDWEYLPTSKWNDTEDVVGETGNYVLQHPTSKLELVGVYGHNGKTTIATLLYNMFL